MVITEQVSAIFREGTFGGQSSKTIQLRWQDQRGLGIYHAYLMSYSQFPAPRVEENRCFLGWDDGKSFAKATTKKNAIQVPELIASSWPAVATNSTYNYMTIT